MLDFVAVVSFGGVVLWSNRKLSKKHIDSINEFIKRVYIECSVSSSTQPYISIDQSQSTQWIPNGNKKLIVLISYPNQPGSIGKNTYLDILTQITALDLSLYTEENKYTFFSNHEIDSVMNGYINNFLSVCKLLPSFSDTELENNPSTKLLVTTSPDQAMTYPSNLQSSMPLREKSQVGSKSSSKKFNRKWDQSSHGKEDDISNLNFGSDENNTDDDTTVRNSPKNPPVSFSSNKGKHIPELNLQRKMTESGILSSLWSKINELGGISKSLTSENLSSPLSGLKESLIKKNVAEPVAAKICDSVEMKLTGKQISSFATSGTISSQLYIGTLHSLIRDATSLIIQQILTPLNDTQYSNDIFLGMAEVQEQGRPFVITLVGVNGVGKSTSLSKLVYWTLQRGFKVLVVAGDTFRSGAVEQLATHVKNLSKVGPVSLFEKGYGKDASAVAREAIQYAKTNAIDVIFIDTAGRMQDNIPLMKSLAKLISVANPDRIIFVGEALVGNEAVDQLTKFNSALVTYAPAISSSTFNTIRTIDGIMLTKFDTIDDKVGAAVSMAYVSGAPILFVGVGQTYLDLRRLNVKSIVDSLLDL